MNRMILLCALSWIVLPMHMKAQGCSDAGFCSAGAMQTGVTDNLTRGNSYGAAVTAGIGENSTLILSLQAEARLQLTSKDQLEVKVPFSYADGNLGSYAGVGDPIITVTRKFRKKFSATIGTRIGSGNANGMDNGKVLPMPYQSSLGTTDLIAGAGVKIARYLSVAAGYQQPLIQYNQNTYATGIMTPLLPQEYIYFDSRKLERQGDVLLRLDGTLQIQRVTLSLGPLLIYHLGEDTYIDNNGARATLTGSDGLTLNIAGSARYKCAAGIFELVGGTPMIVRDSRPDGLTRALVLTLRYSSR